MRQRNSATVSHRPPASITGREHSCPHPFSHEGRVSLRRSRCLLKPKVARVREGYLGCGFTRRTTSKRLPQIRSQSEATSSRLFRVFSFTQGSLRCATATLGFKRQRLRRKTASRSSLNEYSCPHLNHGLESPCPVNRRGSAQSFRAKRQARQIEFRTK